MKYYRINEERTRALCRVRWRTREIWRWHDGRGWIDYSKLPTTITMKAMQTHEIKSNYASLLMAIGWAGKFQSICAPLNNILIDIYRGY